jgi:hypothetical protein
LPMSVSMAARVYIAVATLTNSFPNGRRELLAWAGTLGLSMSSSIMMPKDLRLRTL